MQPTTQPNSTASQKARIDRRFFEITTTNPKQATQEALHYLRLQDAELLNEEIIQVGKRKFILFGKRETTYKYSIRADYPKLLMPYLERILDISNLDLRVLITSSDKNSITIEFSGKDEPLLEKLSRDFLISIEHLSKVFLGQRIVFPRDLSFTLKLGEQTLNYNNDNNSRNGNRNSKNGNRQRSQRHNNGENNRYNTIADALDAAILEKENLMKKSLLKWQNMQ